MTGLKIGPPVHKNIIRIAGSGAARDSFNKDQVVAKQLANGQARDGTRLINDGGIQKPVFDPPKQRVIRRHIRRQGNLRERIAQPDNPVGQRAIPMGNLSTQRQAHRKIARQRRFLPGLGPGPDDG